jgi:type VI secretion system protein VasD
MKMTLTFERTLFRLIFSGLILSTVLAGCAAVSLGQVATGVLQVAGLVQAEGAKAPALKEVPLRIFAGNNLNSDAKGRPLAVVVKLYKLRNNATFLAASYDALADSSKERQVIGQDLLEMREIVLTPGQKLEFKEKLATETGFLAIAVLFRSPAADRWRYTFAVDEKNQKGVNIGVHACAITVSVGEVSGNAGADVGSLNGVRCAPDA